MRRGLTLSLAIASLSLFQAGLVECTPAEAKAANSARNVQFGPFGPEGSRFREQLWVLPGGDPDVSLRATVFRPADDDKADQSQGEVRRPMIVINHGTSDFTRLSVSMPVYYWLSRWFVERGYVVVLPQRRGHGATGGPLAESIGTCANPNHLASGRAAADDIEAVVDYMTQQPFVEPGKTIVAGISTGGWASLALAARNPANVRAVINFAGGRGGHAGGRSNAVCGEDALIAAAGTYGGAARIPTLWLYSENDSYFGPKLARAMAGAWTARGGRADLRVLPPYEDDGHQIADDWAGRDLWGSWVDQFLEESATPQMAGNHAEATADVSSAVESSAETSPVQSVGNR